MRRLIALMVTVASPVGISGLSAASAQSATAADQGSSVTAQAEALAAQANTRYKAKDYGGAVDLYLQAYNTAPSVAMLYNVAHIYDRKLSEPELAMDYYRRVIRSEDADGEISQRASKRVRELRVIEQTRKDAERAEQAVVKTAPPPTPAKKSSNALAYTLMGVGTASLGAGIYFGLQANSSQSDFDASDDPTRRGQLEDDGTFQAGMADGLMGAGLVLGAVGLGLMLAGSAETSVAVSPEEGGASIWWGGAL